MPFDEILKNVSGLGHDDYPLLDPIYSPNSKIPVVDFSQILRDLILEDDWMTIHEFLTELSGSHHIADAAVRTFKGFRLENYIIAEDSTIAELIAILILVYRIYFYTTPHIGSPTAGILDGSYCLIVRLFQNALACANAKLTPAAKTVLLERLSDDLAQQSRGFSCASYRQPSETDLEEIEQPPTKSAIAKRIASIPVTSKSVIFDAMEQKARKGSCVLRLRYELQYGERQFGNNSARNRDYVQWVNIFKPAKPTTDISKLLSKDEIRTEAGEQGVVIPKSYTRSRMLSFLKESGGSAYDNLFIEATKDYVRVGSDVVGDIKEIMLRRERIEYACKALAAI